MTPPELYSKDCIGLTRFTTQQAKAIVDMVRTRGLLICDPPSCEGKGIVIAGGGRYLDWSYVLVRWLRVMHCQLPIQVWHLGPKEMPPLASKLLAQMGAETVDAHQVMLKHPVREMGPWILKTYAIRHCPWKNVMLIDADCVAKIVPEELFNDEDVQKHGSLFFHDVGKHNSWHLYADFSLIPMIAEWETGAVIIDKVKGWMGLRWAMWCAEHTDVFWNSETGGHGEKSTVECAFRSSGVPFMMGGPSVWAGYGIEHSFKGRVAFSHLMGIKRKEWPMFAELVPLFEEFKSFKL